MDENELKNIVEALLLSSNEPISLEKLLEIFDDWQRPTIEQLKSATDQLRAEYSGRAFELIEVASGYQVQTKSDYSNWVARLQIEKPSKYSRALLETLSIIAYKQPVTRADIEEVRGVAVNTQIMKTLMEREWIRIAGHKDVAGKPAVYTTTRQFLNYFNLNHLHELPSLSEVLDTSNGHKANQPLEECVTE